MFHHRKIYDIQGKVYPRTGHKGRDAGQRYSTTLSLTSSVEGVGGQRQASTVLTPEERRFSHCAGGWVSRWVGVQGCGKSLLHRVSIPGPFSPQRVDIRTEQTRPTVPNMNSLRQRFSNFFQVGTTFISQNVLLTTLILGLSNSLGLP